MNLNRVSFNLSVEEANRKKMYDITPLQGAEQKLCASVGLDVSPLQSAQEKRGFNSDIPEDLLSIKQSIRENNKFLNNISVRNKKRHQEPQEEDEDSCLEVAEEDPMGRVAEQYVKKRLGREVVSGKNINRVYRIWTSFCSLEQDLQEYLCGGQDLKHPGKILDHLFDNLTSVRQITAALLELNVSPEQREEVENFTLAVKYTKKSLEIEAHEQERVDHERHVSLLTDSNEKHLQIIIDLKIKLEQIMQEATTNNGKLPIVVKFVAGFIVTAATSIVATLYHNGV